MILRVIMLFLLAMVLIALVGRWLWPRPSKPPPRALRPPAAVLCIHCGTPIPGGGSCPCGGTQRKG